MGVVIPDGYAQVQLLFSSPYFVKGYAQTSFGVVIGEAGDLPTLAQVVWEAFEAQLPSVMSIDQTLVSVKAVGPTTVGEVNLPIAGGMPELLCPPNSALLMKLTSGVRGRAHQGRMYWPGFLPEEQVDSSGNIDPEYLSNLQADFNAFGAAWVSEDYSGVILHSSEALEPTPILGSQLESKIATQRRRLR